MTAPSIFICYRRGDAAGYAFALWRELQRCFGPEAVFFDRDDRHHLPSGCDWEKRLFAALDTAPTVVAVIGPDWLDCQDEHGRRRLDMPQDVVRRELARALARHGSGKAGILPALFGKASMPDASHLPDELQKLATIQARPYKLNIDFDNQFECLRKELATYPGMPALSPYVGRQGHYHTIDQALSPYFADPSGHLPALRQTLERQGSAAVIAAATVQGMGGVGKTQLALAYSDLHRYAYAGVWWFRAETDTSLEQDCAAFCETLGIDISRNMPTHQAVKDWAVRETEPWLLVFDNAEDARALQAWLPRAGGAKHHIVVTSRQSNWELGAALELDVWNDDQALEFLRSRLPATSDDERRGLNQTLGGLPLALEQACAYLGMNMVSVPAYIAGIEHFERQQRLLNRLDSSLCPRSVQATLSLAFERLSAAARELLSLCAWLAPDPIPEYLFTENSEQLPDRLKAIAEDELAWRETVAELAGYALCQISSTTLTFHRLTQAAVFGRWKELEDARVAITLVYMAFPEDTGLPDNWTRCEALTPHTQHFEHWLGCGINLDVRLLVWLLDRLADYFVSARGLYGETERLQRKALELNRKYFGEEDPSTLASMNNLAGTLRTKGDLAGAMELHVPALEAARRVFGQDDQETLKIMNNLAYTLSAKGDLNGARKLEEALLETRRRTLGEGDDDTHTSMNNLAETLRELGGWNNLARARKLFEKALEGRRHNLAKQHPNTLRTMSNLALTLEAQGNLAGAQKLGAAVLEARSLLFVEAHPDTIISAWNLFRILPGLAGLKVFERHLAHLLDADPRTLIADLRGIRDELLKLPVRKRPS